MKTIGASRSHTSVMANNERVDETTRTQGSDESVEGTTRTRRIRVRAAHRGTVTRLVNQLDEALHSTDVGRLKHLKQTLSKKMAILSALDEGILAEIEEDHVEAEIEQADLIREEAELAIISIDEVLLSLKHDSRRKPPSNRRSSSLSSGDEDDPTLSRPSQAVLMRHF